MHTLYSVGAQISVYSRGRQPMARGPNVALFKLQGAKKGHQEKFGKVGKKARVDGPQQKRFLIFPFFGPPSTKGWQPLVYSIHYISYNIQ